MSGEHRAPMSFLQWVRGHLNDPRPEVLAPFEEKKAESAEPPRRDEWAELQQLASQGVPLTQTILAPPTATPKTRAAVERYRSKLGSDLVAVGTTWWKGQSGWVRAMHVSFAALMGGMLLSFASAVAGLLMPLAVFVPLALLGGLGFYLTQDEAEIAREDHLLRTDPEIVIVDRAEGTRKILQVLASTYAAAKERADASTSTKAKVIVALLDDEALQARLWDAWLDVQILESSEKLEGLDSDVQAAVDRAKLRLVAHYREAADLLEAVTSAEADETASSGQRTLREDTPGNLLKGRLSER